LDILRLGPQGRERPVARVGGDLFDLTPLTQDVDGRWLAAGGLAAARDALQRGAPPLIEDPGRVGDRLRRHDRADDHRHINTRTRTVGEDYAAESAPATGPSGAYVLACTMAPAKVSGASTGTK
jgi:hypothetical protein